MNCLNCGSANSDSEPRCQVCRKWLLESSPFFWAGLALRSPWCIILLIAGLVCLIAINLIWIPLRVLIAIWWIIALPIKFGDAAARYDSRGWSETKAQAKDWLGTGAPIFFPGGEELLSYPLDLLVRGRQQREMSSLEKALAGALMAGGFMLCLKLMVFIEGALMGWK